MPRLLLVELATDDPFARYRSELYPFLQGYAKTRGATVQWVTLPIQSQDLTARHVVDLHANTRERLRAAIDGFYPTHLLLNEHPTESLRTWILSQAPGTQLATTERGTRDWARRDHVDDWLGLGAGNSSHIVDVADPDYTCDVLTEGTMHDFVHVLAGPGCFHQRSLRRNPHYRSLGATIDPVSSGCTFCECPTHAKYPYETRPVDLVFKQIVAAFRTRPARRPAGQFLMLGLAPFFLMGSICRSLLQRDLPPSSLLFSCRIDEVLRMADTIEESLSLLKGTGHAIHIHNMGVENFAPSENDRFNKFISQQQVANAVALLNRWERTHPETFGFNRYGGFGFITFTPWTKLEDLETNLRALKELNLEAGELFATSRLILLPGRPIEALARHDGLTAKRFDDPAVEAMVDGGCLTSWDQVEVPWRFAHPEVAKVYSILVRSGKGPGSRGDDDLTGRVRRTLRKLPEQHRPPVGLMPIVVQAARELPDGSVEQLLARVETLAAGEGGGAPWKEVVAPLARLLDRVGRHASRPMGGFTVESLHVRPDDPNELRVTICDGEQRVELMIRPAGGFARPYLETPRVAVVHGRDTPIDTTIKDKAVRLVVASIERLLGQAAPLGLSFRP